LCPPTQIQCPHPEQADIITQGTVTDAFAVVEVDWDPKCRLKFKVPQHVNKDWRSATCFTVTGSLTELTESHPHAPGPGERQRRPPAHLVDDAPAPAQKAKAKPKPKPVNLDAPDAQKAKAKRPPSGARTFHAVKAYTAATADHKGENFAWTEFEEKDDLQHGHQWTKDFQNDVDEITELQKQLKMKVETLRIAQIRTAFYGAIQGKLDGMHSRDGRRVKIQLDLDKTDYEAIFMLKSVVDFFVGNRAVEVVSGNKLNIFSARALVDVAFGGAALHYTSLIANQPGAQELTPRRQEKLKGGSMMLMPQCMVKIDGRDTNAIVLDIFDGNATIMKLDDSQDLSQRQAKMDGLVDGGRPRKNDKTAQEIWQLQKANEVQAEVSEHPSCCLQPSIV
jgi:hypothetical protein